jgi:predicted DNA-binding transcriptional regulator YafY
MLQTSARLLRLVALLQARRFWTGAELCERLDVTDRTLRRDINRVRSLGYPVQATSGVAGGYQLGAGATLPPLQLEDDEALAVAVALGTAATGSVSGIEEAALRAQAKLEQVLPQRLRRRVNTLRANIVSLQRSRVLVDAELLSSLANACRDNLSLEFGYSDGKKQTSSRRAEPHAVVHTGYRWYLVAWDLDREDFRTFRADRIVGKPLSGPRFNPRPAPDGDLKAYVSRALSTRGYEFQARVLVRAPLEAVAERVSPAAGFLRAIDAQSCELSFGAQSLDTLATWLLGLGVDFEVYEPPALSQHLQALHERLGRVLGALGNERSRE